MRGTSRNRFFLLPSWAHAAEAHVLGTRCVAAGPLGLAWPPSIPCRALMRKNPAFPTISFLTNFSHELKRLPCARRGA